MSLLNKKNKDLEAITERLEKQKAINAELNNRLS